MSEQSRRIEAMTGAHETHKQSVIREFGLPRDEVARAGIMRAGDPVSEYAGSFAVQAEMMVDERRALATQTVSEMPEQIANGYN